MILPIGISESSSTNRNYVAISGGIGGAKLALGLSHLLGERLTIIVNTGDDFEHLGLHVSPDIDTTLYTLAGIANPDTGWGRANETWNFMHAAETLGAPQWFRLGDKDLAMNVLRSARLRDGESLTDITADMAHRLSIPSKIVPMSDEPVRTTIETPDGMLDFQDYFVRQGCKPRALAIHYRGVDRASPSAAALAALGDPNLAGIIVCPSNPYLSVEPIFAVSAMREAIANARPVIAVSPIIGGTAVKGPAAKLMAELGYEVSTATVAAHYGELLDGFVLDKSDADLSPRIAAPSHVTDTLMVTTEDKVRLAGEVLAFSDRLFRETAGHQRETAV